MFRSASYLLRFSFKELRSSSNKYSNSSVKIKTLSDVGRGSLIAGSAIGLGCLCYYGYTSKLDGRAAIDKAIYQWPDYVSKRIHTSYTYLGCGLAVTAASFMATLRNKRFLDLINRRMYLYLFAGYALTIGSSILVQSIPYSDKNILDLKHCAWLAHSSIIGAFIAPCAAMGGHVALRAAMYTAGIFAGLTSIAVVAPSEQFLKYGAPLGMGLGAVFVSSLATFFLPVTSKLGFGFYAIAMYGGIVVFSGLLLYDTQKLVKRAETHPHDAFTVNKFDPISASLSIYMDIINLFIRLMGISKSNK